MKVTVLGMYCHAEWQIGTNILKECAALPCRVGELKCWYQSIELYGITPWETVICILIVMITQNLM